jgi:hypothetical protein
MKIFAKKYDRGSKAFYKLSMTGNYVHTELRRGRHHPCTLFPSHIPSRPLVRLYGVQSILRFGRIRPAHLMRLQSSSHNTISVTSFHVCRHIAIGNIPPGPDHTVCRHGDPKRERVEEIEVSLVQGEKTAEPFAVLDDTENGTDLYKSRLVYTGNEREETGGDVPRSRDR